MIASRPSNRQVDARRVDGVERPQAASIAGSGDEHAGASARGSAGLSPRRNGDDPAQAAAIASYGFLEVVAPRRCRGAGGSGRGRPRGRTTGRARAGRRGARPRSRARSRRPAGSRHHSAMPPAGLRKVQSGSASARAAIERVALLPQPLAVGRQHGVELAGDQPDQHQLLQDRRAEVHPDPRPRSAGRREWCGARIHPSRRPPHTLLLALPTVIASLAYDANGRWAGASSRRSVWCASSTTAVAPCSGQQPGVRRPLAVRHHQAGRVVVVGHHVHEPG